MGRTLFGLGGAGLALSVPAAVWAAMGFEAPKPLNSNADTDSGFDDAASIVTDSDGHWVAVWHSDDSIAGGTPTFESDIYVTRSANNGITWTTPAAVNDDATFDFSNDVTPQIATDLDGVWISVWGSSGRAGGDYDLFFSRSTDNGVHWGSLGSLNGDAEDDAREDELPQIATDGKGNWIVVWTCYDAFQPFGQDRDIFYSRSANDGVTWTAALPLNTNAATDAGDDWDPQIATDGVGNWVVVWGSADSLNSTIGNDYDILCARTTDDGQHWTSPAAINSNASSDTGADWTPQIATDRRGRWITVWRSNQSSGSATADDDIFFSRSANNGAGWSAVQRLNTNGGGDSGEDSTPQIASDKHGNWIVVWRSNDTLGGTKGSDFDILVTRSTDNGTNWSAPAPLNTNAAADSLDDSAPRAAADGFGNWIAVWTQKDTPIPPIDDDLYYSTSDEILPQGQTSDRWMMF